MADHVTIRYERELDHPVEAAYEWLTDYQDDDPDRAGAVVVERPVLERSETKVVLKGTVEVLGDKGTGLTEVDLMPPDKWRARIVDGRGRGSVYEYRLEPLDGGDRSRLVVDYHIRVKRFSSKLKVLLGRPFVRRELDRMWAGFAKSMDEELAAEDAETTVKA